MSRDKYTTCTAVASDLGFTVLTYGTRQLYGPSLASGIQLQAGDQRFFVCSAC
jgi:hypothetical protein